MPKQKTRKSVAKRCKLTARGKIKRTTAGRGHLLSGKSSKRKRQLRGGGMVSKSDYHRIVSQLAH
jgi:large subunit ribosomal protein L35